MARNRIKRKVVAADWLVVMTHQFAEDVATAELRKQDFDAMYPRMRLPANRLGVCRVVPLFEGYTFVRECGRWWSIRGTRGVSQLLMSAEGPAVIADEQLQFFLSVSVDGEGFYVDEVPSIPARVFEVGELAIPRSGAWSGQSGKITSLDSNGRCELLYSLLGRDVKVRTQVSELA